MTITKDIVADYSAPTNGTSDARAAFLSFRTFGAAQTDDIVLTVPAHTYTFKLNPGDVGDNFLFKGIKSLIVEGAGATWNDDSGNGGFQLGGLGAAFNNTHDARVATVAAGATSVTLLTLSDASLFTANTWACLTGVDQMGFGDPANPSFFEYVFITNVDVGTGVITFSLPLRYSYKSTWPVFNTGGAFNSDCGGPGTLYALDPSWDCSLEYRGLTISQSGHTYAVGRAITYRNCIATGGGGPIPTQNKTWSMIGCTGSNAVMEADKIIESMVVTNSTAKQILFQSRSVQDAVFDTVTLTDVLNGTPQKLTHTNCNFNEMRIGPGGYGNTLEIAGSGSTVSLFSANPCHEDLVNVSNYSMSGGVISRPLSPSGPPTWAVPGARCLFGGGNWPYAVPFTVTDLTTDGTNVYVATSLSGGFPDFLVQAGLTNQLTIKTHPAVKFSAASCIGCAQIVDLSQLAGRPYGSYSKQSFTGMPTTTSDVDLFGLWQSVTVNVTTPYTGVSTLTMKPLGIFGSQMIDAGGGAVLTDLGLVVNMKVAGVRTITRGAVTGAQSGDTLSAPGNVSFAANSSPYLTRDISGESSGVWPIYSVEYITDQGITPTAVAPLRLRLHA